MKIVLIGAPGSGKGTLAKKLSRKYHVAHISTGDIIRDHIKRETTLGLKVKHILESGNLVSDETIMELVNETLNSKEISKHGYILDGFPRTVAQAQWFNQNCNVDYYIIFDVSKETVIERISGRRMHPASNRIYHIKYAAPKIEGKDDVTGESLIQREDDKEEKILTRLQVYEELTFPIIEYLEQHTSNYFHINAELSEQEILSEVKSKIRN